MGEVTTYDARRVNVVVGPSILSGFGPEDMVRVERNADTYTLQMGADGEFTRTKTNDRSGRVTFLLMQTSDANLILSALAQADELTNLGVVPLLILDTNGASLYAAEKAWLMKPPASTRGREASVLEWTFETGHLVWFEGG